MHARLADNVEISNPMYLAGEDEPEPAPEPAPSHPHKVTAAHYFLDLIAAPFFLI